MHLAMMPGHRYDETDGLYRYGEAFSVTDAKGTFTHLTLLSENELRVDVHRGDTTQSATLAVRGEYIRTAEISGRYLFLHSVSEPPAASQSTILIDISNVPKLLFQRELRSPVWLDDQSLAYLKRSFGRTAFSRLLRLSSGARDAAHRKRTHEAVARRDI